MSLIPRLVLVAAVVAGLGLTVAAPAAEARAVAARGAAVQTHITLSPASGPPGTAIRVSGSGFAVGELVRISLAAIDHTAVRANRRGSFSGALVNVGRAVPGAYRVMAVGRRSGRQARATFTVHTNWAQYGYGPARIGYNSAENVLSASVVPSLGLAWRFDTGNEAFSSAAVVNGVAYVGSLSGAVYALNAATGAKRWTFRTDGAVNSSPAVVGGKAYVGSEGSRVYAIGTVHGIRRWMYRTGAAVFGSPAVLNGTVYVAAVNGTVYAFNAATGAWRWRVKLRTEVAASVAVANGVVYVPAEPGGLYALSAATGAPLWHALLPGYAVSAPAVADGRVYLGTDHTDVGDLLAFNAVTGKRIWDVQNANGAVDAAPAVANGVVYWVANGNAYATNAATGTNVWSVSLTPMVMGSDPAVADGVVYFGAGDGNLYALDAASGSKLGVFSTGSTIESSPAVADGRVYVGSDNHYEYAFGLPSS